MNSLFALLGIDTWKPVVTALLLPPVPLLLLILVGAWSIPLRRWLGWLLVLLGTIGIWLSACTNIGNLLTTRFLHPPQPLSGEQLSALRAEAKARSAVTIVVLGGGAAAYAPHFGVSGLTQQSMERLRYGLWLSRETGVPVGFSGGQSWTELVGPAESEVAARVAAREFGLPLKWTEGESRDTVQNARLTIILLKQMGIKHAVLVTHDWHMPRALALFKEAAAGRIEIEPAPLSRLHMGNELGWLPTADGFTSVRQALRELLAELA